MTKRTRLVFLALGLITLISAVWIAASLRNGDITSTDETVEIEVIPPAGS